MIVSWNTTNACNLKCAHCYRDAGVKAEEELSTAEAKKLLEGIFRAGFKIMIFSGGEPLLRPDIMELTAYAANLGLAVVFGTNGTLITPEKAQVLKAAGAGGMGISLDSLEPERHDRLRGKTGAWQQAVEGMKNCREAGLPFQVHTTVMGWNEGELEAMTDFAVKLGARAHHLFFLVPTGRGADLGGSVLTPEQHEAVLARIMKKQSAVDIELKPTCAPQFIRIAAELGIQTRFRRGCLAGLAYAVISPKGLVQPCAYLPLYLGDVHERPFDEIWRDSDVLKKLRTLEYGGNCGRCRFKHGCGGCRARAAVYSGGDYMAADPWCRLAPSMSPLNESP